MISLCPGMVARLYDPERQRQEDGDFKVSQGYAIARLCLKKISLR